MGKVKKRVPELRFKGFEDDWEQRKLINETVFFNQKRVPIDSQKRQKGNYPYYGATGIIDYVEDYIFEGEYVLLAEDGANIITRNSPIAYQTEGRFWVNNHAHIMQMKTGSNFFLLQILENKNYKKYNSGTAQPKLNSNVVKNIKFNFPSDREQNKIGVFFEQLDDAIALHQQKLDKLEQMKEGLLQLSFPSKGMKTPFLRFAKYNDNWGQRKLGEVSEKVTEKNKNNIYTETLTNSAEFGIISQRDFFDKDISNEKNLNGYFIVHPDDFVYNPRISNFAPVGPIKRNKLGRTGVMSPLYYVFRTQEIDRTYLEKYFSGDKWHRFMKSNGDTGARSDRFAISGALFQEMPIPYPTIDEQNKIGNFLNTLDETIILYSQKIKKLKNTKKVLLQKMFI